jgi:hypothetical protein
MRLIPWPLLAGCCLAACQAKTSENTDAAPANDAVEVAPIKAAGPVPEAKPRAARAKEAEAFFVAHTHAPFRDEDGLVVTRIVIPDIDSAQHGKYMIVRLKSRSENADEQPLESEAYSFKMGAFYGDPEVVPGQAGQAAVKLTCAADRCVDSTAEDGSGNAQPDRHDTLLSLPYATLDEAQRVASALKVIIAFHGGKPSPF